MKRSSWLALMISVALCMLPSQTLRAKKVACTNDTWTSQSVAKVPKGFAGLFSAESSPACVWTGDEMVVWGDPAISGGAAYDIATNTWTAIKTKDQPDPRTGFASVWTPAGLLIWGGRDTNQTPLNTGFLYNRDKDKWTPVSLINAPPAGTTVAVSIGANAIVWGGNGGAIYNPVTNFWTPISNLNAPPQPQSPANVTSAVWTGSEMIVWGAGVGGRYSPKTDSWMPISTLHAPPGTADISLVWTGTEVIAWGGVGGEGLGGTYNPVSDTWAPISTAGAPPNVTPAQVTVWTGSEMMVWGTQGPSAGSSAGGRYDPATNTWSPISTTSAPGPGFFAGIWTGTQMLVVGSLAGGTQLATATYCATPPTPSCVFALAPQIGTFGSNGGSSTVMLTASSGCGPWTITDEISWITIQSGTAGTGSSMITLAAAPNLSSAFRSATITIAGQIFAVSEAGAPTITNVGANGTSLVVGGTGFDRHSVILLGGVAQTTGHKRAPNIVIGKNSVPQVPSGQSATVQVKNSDGALSNQATFSRP
jgi:hypothetical protein